MVVKPGLFAFRAGELLSYAAGVLLTGFFAVQLAQGEVERRQGIAGFEAAAVQYAANQSGAVSEQAALSQSTALSQRTALSKQTVPQFPPSGELVAVNSATAEHPVVHASSAALAMLEQVPDSLDPQQFDHLPTVTDVGQPDTTLWAPSRVEDYQRSLNADLPSVLGVLEVPSVKLKVPVYSEDTDLTMDRGAGIISGMAFPHEAGNIGISGHRDGYFRALKDIQIGDRIILQTLEGHKYFVVEAAHIVEISDIALLQDTEEQTVTLVTCYPFYFVGHAPQRFIVTASLDTTNVNQN